VSGPPLGCGLVFDEPRPARRSRPVINIILHPGQRECQVTVTTDSDQIAQQFDAPQAALDAVTLVREVLALVCGEYEARLEAARREAEEAEEDDQGIVQHTHPASGSYLDDAGPLAGQDFPSGPSQAFGGAPLGAAIIDPHGETELGQLASGSVVPQDVERLIAPPADAVAPGPPLTPSQLHNQRIEYLLAAARETAAAARRTADMPERDTAAVARLLQGAADSYEAAMAQSMKSQEVEDEDHALTLRVLGEIVVYLYRHMGDLTSEPALAAALSRLDALQLN
jgi:hypothetical protein